MNKNGTVERRHRHIVETGITLLGQCNAPLPFWNYAFESLIYLINCMPTLVLQNKSLFECLFRRTPDYNFLRTFRCLCFPFLRTYHAHKLDFFSSPCVLLGYSSSHLGYRCLDLASHRIYVSRHVCFHETVFPFVNSEHITHTLTPSTQPTHLLTLHPSQFFHPTPFPTSPTQYPYFALCSIPSASLAILSPAACFSNDHYARTCSPSPDAFVFMFDAAEQPSSAVASPVSAAQCSPSTASPAGLQLCADLSSYPLQPLSGTGSLSTRPTAHQHPMVLRPRQLKTAMSTATATASAASFSRVVSLPTHEQLFFNDANRYETWHNAMHEEIQALRANITWSLVSFHPSMSVVGSRWVYKIKRRSDGSIERYKARLVARGFTQQEGIDYSETFSPVIKQAIIRLVFSIIVSCDWKIH